MAGPLREEPPFTPSSLMAVDIWNVGKQGSKKSYFFLNGPALYPLPLPAIKRRTFFCGFPKGRRKNKNKIQDTDKSVNGGGGLWRFDLSFYIRRSSIFRIGNKTMTSDWPEKYACRAKNEHKLTKKFCQLIRNSPPSGQRLHFFKNYFSYA